MREYVTAQEENTDNNFGCYTINFDNSLLSTLAVYYYQHWRCGALPM